MYTTIYIYLYYIYFISHAPEPIGLLLHAHRNHITFTFDWLYSVYTSLSRSLYVPRTSSFVAFALRCNQPRQISGTCYSISFQCTPKHRKQITHACAPVFAHRFNYNREISPPFSHCSVMLTLYKRVLRM